LEAWQKRIEQIRGNRPIYRDIFDFYQKVREEQERIAVSLTPEFHLPKKNRETIPTAGSFPLLRKQDFPLDLDASVQLFQSLCRIAEKANPFLADQASKIEETVRKWKLTLKKLLADGLDDQKAAAAAEKFNWDEKVFSFLIQTSLKPSIMAAMKLISKDLKPVTLSKGDCPVCGSLPDLALLDEEVGKKSVLCSFCGYRWQIERLLCTFCKNQEQNSLHYLAVEGEDSCRIDLCEKCRHYIKTIDLRKTEGCDPSIEDLATLHLDILASQRGYERTVPTPWIRPRGGGVTGEV
jgi:FdhE protein